MTAVVDAAVVTDGPTRSADFNGRNYEDGRLDVAHHRGRSIQPRLLQAAEHFVRDSEGLNKLDDLTVAD